MNKNESTSYDFGASFILTIYSASTVLALEFVENIDDTTFALGTCCFCFGALYIPIVC